jgi:hypothetical protein
VLFAYVRITPARQKIDGRTSTADRQFRVLITADSGFSYGYYPVRNFPEAKYAYFTAHDWPRTSRLLRIRIEEESNPAGSFRQVASFSVRNPKPTKPPQWTAERSLKATLSGSLEVEFGNLLARTRPREADEFGPDTGELRMRVIEGGETLTNWGISSDSGFSDSAGNTGGFGEVKWSRQGYGVYPLLSFHALDPFQPWQFRITVERQAQFPETNLFRFAVPSGMSGTNQTNFAGVPVNISFANTMLAIELPTRPKELRLSFVSAFGDDGTSIDGRSGSSRAHDFWRRLTAHGSSNIHATL